MKACVFVGPTLPSRDPARRFDATWMPPARHGDVFQAVTTLRPRAIGIIDGFFQWAPAVWHKEILWAIHGGVHVFGAASMGALRAAELAPFGMRGVGAIFEAYRDGAFAACGADAFEDDDEVAVVHGPEESGYLAASEAMVNIRCTLARAEREGTIDAAMRRELVAIAKALFFPDRTYETVLRRAREAGLPRDALDRLQAWLPSGRVDQKRLDAVAMLETLTEFLARDPAQAHANFVFEHTLAWDRAVQGLRASAPHSPEDLLALTELRLDDARFLAWRREAIDRLTRSRDADDPTRTRDETFEPVLIERHVLSRARAEGEYGTLLERGRRKEACIARQPGMPRASDFPGWKLLDLRDWFFSKVRGSEMPDDLDDYLAELGYADETAFHEALLAEFVYRRDGG
jgi:hypothetical protein